MSLLDFVAELRRQETAPGARDRRDVCPWTEIPIGVEVELIRVKYASPRLIAVHVFMSGNPQAIADLDDSPRIYFEAGTDNGTIKYCALTGVSRLIAPASPGSNAFGADGLLYPPAVFANGQSASGDNVNLRTFTATVPFQVPAQYLRVTARRPIKTEGGAPQPIAAIAICAPVVPDVTERYAEMGIAMMSKLLRGRR